MDVIAKCARVSQLLEWRQTCDAELGLLTNELAHFFNPSRPPTELREGDNIVPFKLWPWRK